MKDSENSTSSSKDLELKELNLKLVQMTKKYEKANQDLIAERKGK